MISNKDRQRENRRKRKQAINAYYIYALCDPTTKQVRYIGYTYHPSRRLNGHIADARNKSQNPLKKAWLLGLAAKNLKPTMRVLERTDEANVTKREEYWYKLAIQCGCDLINDKGKIGAGLK